MTLSRHIDLMTDALLQLDSLPQRFATEVATEAEREMAEMASSRPQQESGDETAVCQLVQIERTEDDGEEEQHPP